MLLCWLAVNFKDVQNVIFSEVVQVVKNAFNWQTTPI